MANGVWVWVCGSLTFGEVIDANVVELLDLFHDQLLFVDLNHHRGMPSISPGESELAEGCLELLRNVDGTGLWVESRGSPDTSKAIATESSG